MDIDELLNKASADEWLAYYQYRIGAQALEGQPHGEAEAELLKYANDEHRQTQMLSDRISQLDGTPLMTPENWYKHTNYGYEAPENPSVKKIINQDIKGERCACKVYWTLADRTKETDPVTHKIVLGIMHDKIEHEDDLEGILDDIKHM